MFSLDDHGVMRTSLPDGIGVRLVVPRKCIPEVISLCYDIPTSGHQGIKRTGLKVKERYYWYKLSSDIKEYVRTCQVCNRNKKANRNARCHMTQFHASAPMERVHLDFLGPLPETKFGNVYVLMMVDQFTQWVEYIPLPSQTAEVTARAAVNEFCTRFGFPFHIFTDQGRNFESNLFKAICDLLHIQKTRTTPYRPGANGQVERFNRTLMNAVRCFVSKQQGNWDENITQFTGAIRSFVNRSTGLSPNQVMLGRKVNSPVDLVFPPAQENEDNMATDYVARLKKSIQISH